VTLRPVAGAFLLIGLILAACTNDVGNALARTAAPSEPTVTASPEALPLLGTTWRLTTFAGGDVVFSVIGGADITTVFTADGTVVGSSGCNGFTGTYTSAGSTMAFSPLATTKMRCAGPLMAQESAFLDSMGQVTSVSLDGAKMMLLDGHDRVLLTFEGSAG
jgi:heat shock protein HslJ